MRSGREIETASLLYFNYRVVQNLTAIPVTRADSILIILPTEGHSGDFPSGVNKGRLISAQIDLNSKVSDILCQFARAIMPSKCSDN